MSVDPKYPDITDNLLYLAQNSHDWESVRWLAWLDECFDGGDFDGNFANLEWRIMVLHEHYGDDILALVDDIDECLRGPRQWERHNRVEPWPSLRMKVEQVGALPKGTRLTMAHPSQLTTAPWRVLVCPKCGATSVGPKAGDWWSRAGACHIDREVQPIEYVPRTEAA